MSVSPLPVVWDTRDVFAPAAGRGLTLVHFSAQLEPYLSQENTLHTLRTLNTS